ncbi:alpha/beta hydrolase [Nocardia vermiculata]|uniref:Alpha/beta hydrolase n=1 Tax=Nocardia vermiculata TaxID=257274 RepID=A0A846XZY4_9NOCA|nr:alpha/beta hydrolase [Nocardia vermiculata]NKY51402.1 alpha/beta hydrolase [Nocardia vermiculata]
MRVSLWARVIFAAIMLCGFATGVATADTEPAAACRSFPFAVPQGELSATLCTPTGGAQTVMVLMSGSNFNGSYWDFSYQPETYNFRRAMNAAGYATLVVDRLGNGNSTHPPSTSLSATATAQHLHDLVQAAKHGIDGAAPFDKVVTVGHSLTSGTSIMEATQYHDVDGLLLTGYSHAVNIPETLSVIATYHPAVDEPAFSGRGLDPGYLVSKPGTRMHNFYDPGNVDPEVLALDEKQKEVFSLTEYPDGMMSTLPGMSNFLTAPVMIAVGSRDRMLCGIDYAACANSATLHAEEAPFFAPEAKLRTFVLPGSGHAVNLARNTADYQAEVVDWMDTTIGK